MQNLLPYGLLSKVIKHKIYIILILPVVLYECKTSGKGSLRVCENRVLRVIFKPKGEALRGE